MLKLRQLHRYLGVFFTPAIVFFALTGALQALGLHEAERHGDPAPYPWIAAMASLHKDQHLPQPRKAHAAPPAAESAAAAAAPKDEQAAHATPAAAKQAQGEPPEQKSTWPLKLFVLALAAGLCLSSLTGLYIALSNPRSRVQVGLTLAGGVLLPLLLVMV